MDKMCLDMTIFSIFIEQMNIITESKAECEQWWQWSGKKTETGSLISLLNLSLKNG